jgi:hypothetical protein
VRRRGSIAAILFAAACAQAQTTQGLLAGRVVDLQSAHAIAEAEVRAEAVSGALTNVAHSDARGYFSFPLLSPGAYRVRVEAPNYQSQEVYQLEVPVAGRLEIQFRLRALTDVWETRQYRSVFLPESEAILTFYGPDVDTSRSANFDAARGRAGDLETSLSYLVTGADIDRLPLEGRDVFNALVLLPSATADTATGRGLGLTFGGQRPSSSNYLLDGLEFNNALVTGPAARIAPEAIQEYRVSTMNYTAEYGRTSGQVANAITRSGSNAWHGTGYYYLQNESLNANGFAENAQGISRRDARRAQPGARVGGPLRAQRLFLSSSFEYDRFRGTADPQSYALPTASFINRTDANSPAGSLLRRFPAAVTPQGTGDAGLVTLDPPVKLDRHLATTRLDYVSPNGADQIFARGVFANLDQPSLVFNPYPQFSSEFQQRDASFGAGWTRRIRAHLINDLRIGWNFDDPRFSHPNSDVPFLQSAQDFSFGNATYKATLPGSQAAYSYRNRNGTFEALDTVVVTRGASVFKFGGGVLRHGERTFLRALQGGQYVFSDLAALQASSPFFSLLIVDATQTAPSAPPYDRNYGYTQSFAFFDHSIRPLPRLTINYGVRYEYFGAPSNTGPVKDRLLRLGTGADLPARIANAGFAPIGTGNQQLYDADYGDAAIRTGLAYDLFGNGRAVLRASYGIFYDRPFDNLWQTTSTNRLQLIDLTFSNPVNFLGDPFTIARQNPVTNRTTLDQPVMFQPALKNGRVQSFFAGVSQRLTPSLTLETNGLGSLGRRLITTDVVNRPGSVTGTFNNPSGYLNPALGQFYYRGNQGKSDYYALAEVLRYRASRGSAQVSYTWAHAIDLQSEPLGPSLLNYNFFSNASGAAALSSFSRQFDSQGDRGNADFDQRQNLAFFGSYLPPGRWLRGWEIAGLGAIRGGFPYTVLVPSDGIIVNKRANLVANQRVTLDAPGAGGEVLLNPGAFAVPAFGKQGVTGRNAFRGPGLFNIDLSVSRRFAIGERSRVTLRGDAFNVLNHANLNNPSRFFCNFSTCLDTFGTATFGRAEANSGFPVAAPLNETPRQLQILLRFEF